MTRRSLIVLAHLCALGAVPVHFAHAETPAVTGVADAPAVGESVAGESNRPIDQGSVEKIEVTGSHIKRLAVEGASPITTVTRKELDQSGYNSVGDVLRDSNASSFGGMREHSGSNAAGVAHVDLRGLGSGSTLVLLNGQRLPTDAVTGAVDLNMIPMAAVERIEILKDGASAIYGSDALGGVVNIITRKDFNGTEVRVTRSTPEAKGGARTDMSLVNGKSTENVNTVTTAQYRDNEAVFARDREWSKSSPSLMGGPGSYRSGSGPWMADPSCPAERLVTNGQGTFCGFNPADDMTKLPDLRQFGLMSESQIQLGSRIRLTTRLSGTQRMVNWSYAASPGQFVIPAAVAATLGPGGGPLPGTTPGQDLRVRYRLTELGTRDTEVLSYGYNALIGGTVDLASDWQLQATVAHNGVRTDNKAVNGYALEKALTDAIQSGAYNPFAPPGQKGSLDAARYTPVAKTTSLLTSVDVKGSGPLTTLGGGDLSLAIGASITDQLYRDVADERTVKGEVFGNAGSTGGGHRSTQAVYSELAIPVHPKAELTLAGRFDHYSDFGSTRNPKASILVRPVSDVMIRASAGTGFKAPLMQEMYRAASLGYPTFIDHVACNAERAANVPNTPSCTPQQYEVTTGGNPGLREERSISYNVGAIYEPTKKFNIGADMFLTRLKNKVGIDYGDAMKAEAAGIDLAQHGVTVTRDSNGYIETIRAPEQNLAAQHLSGIDFMAGYRISKIRLTNEHSRLLYFREEGFPGMGLKDKLGENGRPIWRNTASIGFMPSERHDLTLAIQTIAGQEKEVAEKGNLPNFTTLDLSYAMKTKRLGTFSLGVKNILGSTPPLDESNPGEQLNDELYDQVGRQVLLGYSKSF